MMGIEKIWTIESILKFITEQEYDKEIDKYRSSFLYRG